MEGPRVRQASPGPGSDLMLQENRKQVENMISTGLAFANSENQGHGDE